MLTQFRYTASGSTTKMITALNAGSWGQSDYRRWGVKAVYNNGSGKYDLKELSCSGASVNDDVNDNTGGCIFGSTLISDFKQNTWYVLQITVDSPAAPKYVLRVWERGNINTIMRAEKTTQDFAAGQTWRFMHKITSGTSWLDEYSEGQLYSIHETNIDSIQTITYGTLPHPSGYGSYLDMKVYWSRPTWDKSMIFDGNASWTATLNRFEYNASEQGGIQYGNQTRLLESYYDHLNSRWQDFRLTRTGFYPKVDASVYLVGLPGYQKQYDCGTKTDGHCSSDYPTYPPESMLSSGVFYLYDGTTDFATPPTTGKLTGQRSLIRFATPPDTDPRYTDVSFGYDSWGNQTTQTQYTAEGSATTLGTGAQTTTTTYDPVYHTYAVAVQDPLKQITTLAYDYDRGVPLRETDPNGITTTATYDIYGRITKVIRQGDDATNPTISFAYGDTSNPFYTEISQRISGSTRHRIRKFITASAN